MTFDKAALIELNSLKNKHGDIPAAAVIEQARSSNSALHRYFTWDDTEAAHAFRMQQAATVIKAVVRQVPQPRRIPQRVVAGTPYARRMDAQVVVTQSNSEDAQAELTRLRQEIAQLSMKHSSSDVISSVFAEIRAAIDRRLNPPVAVKAPPASRPSLSVVPVVEDPALVEALRGLSVAERQLVRYLPRDGGFRRTTGGSMSLLAVELQRRHLDFKLVTLEGPTGHEALSLLEDGRKLREMLGEVGAVLQQSA